MHHDFLIFFVNQDERNLPFLNDVRERFPPLATQPDILFSVPNYSNLRICKTKSIQESKNDFGELEKNLKISWKHCLRVIFPINYHHSIGWFNFIFQKKIASFTRSKLSSWFSCGERNCFTSDDVFTIFFRPRSSEKCQMAVNLATSSCSASYCLWFIEDVASIRVVQILWKFEKRIFGVFIKLPHNDIDPCCTHF